MDDRVRTLLLVAQPLESGVPNHVRDLLPAALDDGWKVEVACPPTSVLWSAAGAFDGVVRHPISSARAPSPTDLRSIARLIPLARRADIVHAHSSKAGVLARVAARITGRTARCVFTPHGWSFWAYRAFLPIERVAAPWCRTIVAVSAFERDAGLDARVGHRDQYVVIPNGVDLDRFTESPVPERDHLVMVARLAPPRRHDVVLRAFAEVRRHRPTATLELIGDGPLRGEITKLAADLGVADAVTFAGDRPDVHERLRRARCLLHASDYEGASLAVLEAMATGRPVVASRLGGMDELVVPGSTGLLCGSDPTEWAAAIMRLLDGDAQAMGHAGRRRAEQRFSLRTMASTTLSLYQQIITARGESAQSATLRGR